jgi:hypothetical protein
MIARVTFAFEQEHASALREQSGSGYASDARADDNNVELVLPAPRRHATASLVVIASCSSTRTNSLPRRTASGA